MISIRNIAIILTYCYMIGICNGSEVFNHSSAGIYCKDNGGLFNYTSVITNGFVKLDHMNPDVVSIPEGESAWISGYISYSSFITWQGCYERNDQYTISRRYSNKENTINFCVNKCKYHDYIGIYANVCRCLKDDWELQKALINIDDVNCTSQKPYNIYFNGSDSEDKVTIHVYRILIQISFDSDNNFKQCLITKDISNRTVYQTSSCYAHSHQTDGVICINGATGKLNDSCQNYFSSNNLSLAFCLENGKTNWIGAYERCNALSGRMLDTDMFTGIKERTAMLKDKYGMGFYRSFEVVNDERKTCLALTNHAGKLILDPDDCSIKKKVICNLSYKPVISTSNRWITETSNPNKNNSIPTVKIGTSSSENENSNTIHGVIYAAIATSVVAVIVVLIILIVRKVKKKQEHVPLTQYVNNESEPTAPQQSLENITLGNDYSDITMQSCKTKVTPKKPERHTLRKKDMTTSYENFKLKPKASSVAAETLNEDYDRIGLNRTQTPSKGDQEHDAEESHVYDHTSLHTSENYDTLRSTKSANLSNCATYSTIQRQRGTKDEKDERFSDKGNKDNDSNGILTAKAKANINGNDLQDETI